MKRSLGLLVGACLALGAAATGGAAGPGLRVVALSGQAAPGGEGGLFTRFGAASLNNLGQVAFAASTNLPTTTRDSGLWSEGSGALALVALEGTHAAGLPAQTVYAEPTQEFSVQLTDSGDTLFYGMFSPRGDVVAGGRADALWRAARGGAPTLLARAGGAMPGLPSNTPPRFLHQPSLSPSGAFALAAPLTGGLSGFYEDRSGVWSSPPSGPLELVTQTGAAAPPQSAGEVFVFDGALDVNAAGDLALVVTPAVAGQQPGAFNSQLWVRPAGGAPSVVLKRGEPIPGAASGVTLESLNNVQMDDLGGVVLGGIAEVGGASTPGAWRWSPEAGFQTLALQGSPAPGVAGATMGFVFTQDPLAVSPRGDALFAGVLAGGGGITTANDFAVWHAPPGLPAEVLLREADPAPGLDGLTFGQAVFASFGQATAFLNRQGRAALLGSVCGPGVTAANDFALWAEDTSGELRLIAREGGTLDLGSPGAPDVRTIASLAFSGYTPWFNDSGQVLFGARFVDGSSGLLVSSLVAVPSPPTCGVGLVFALMLGLRSRPRRR